MTHRLVLTNADHVGDQHVIEITGAGDNLAPDDQDEAAVRLPVGVDLDALRLRCTGCDCVLVRGEDFELEEDEPWRA
jgi:hypothetical protein